MICLLIKKGDNDARIYFLNTFEDMAKKVLCEV